MICAGRPPGKEELSAIKTSDAVVLPQGCSRSLYEMVTDNCPYVFPNYDARFKYPDKLGQIELFRKTGLPHPETYRYPSMGDFPDPSRGIPDALPFDFPFVFKFSWGGEGSTVFLIESVAHFVEVVDKAAMFERTGNTGFLLQEYVQTDRTLRLVVIGETFSSYWRIQTDNDGFGTSVAKGARIDHAADPDLVAAAAKPVRNFCLKTGVNLAGFDVLFAAGDRNPPLVIEINHFFGRRGLGGSEKFYVMLETEINRWLDTLGLSV